LGTFNPQITFDPKQLWRPPLAVLLAAPMASFLRAAFLNSVALPLFTLILGGSAAIGMFIWRGAYTWINRRKAIG